MSTFEDYLAMLEVCTRVTGRPELYEQARALAPQLWVAARAGAALNALHAQEAAQPSAGI